MSTKVENSVVATAEATNVNANVQTAQVEQPAVAAEQSNATSVAQPQVAETIDAIVARMCKGGKSKVVTTAITAIDCEERTAKNGSKYINAFVNLETPVIGSQKLTDGTYRLGLLGAIQFPFNS